MFKLFILNNLQIRPPDLYKFCTIDSTQLLAGELGCRRSDALCLHPPCGRLRQSSYLLTFRDTWIDGPLAKRKKQERLIGFFWACVRRGYITENPTFGLGKIKVDQTPTDYFPPHEFEKIVDATYAYRENRGEIGNTNSTRLRTMTVLMRWSGLRIRDTVTLERSRLHGDSLLLYPSKDRDSSLCSSSISSHRGIAKCPRWSPNEPNLSLFQ
jgi:hypothetical protein